jgi:hypothetical protein
MFLQNMRITIVHSCISLLMALGAANFSWADSHKDERGPTYREYVAALTIVREYMRRERQATAEEGLAAVPYDTDTESNPINTDEVDAGTHLGVQAVVNPGFRVFGSANIEAATVNAISADGNDGAVVVGDPNTYNQALSGRLQFNENIDDDSNVEDLCGFQFVHDGSANTLTLERGCSTVSDPLPLISLPRSASPIIFHNDIGIGGTLFDGNGSGGITGGGQLVISFLGNSALTCNSVCQNHAMTCAFATNLTSFIGSTCGTVASDIDLQLCHCRS